jgi:hypothetical protein
MAGYLVSGRMLREETSYMGFAKYGCCRARFARQMCQFDNVGLTTNSPDMR